VKAERLLFLGTSLTEWYDWPADTQRLLEGCIGQKIGAEVIARGGQTSRWGLQVLTERIRHGLPSPDLVVVEFAVNDADPRLGVSLSESMENHRKILTSLRELAPESGILFLGMYAGHGLRGALRARYGAYVAQVADLAKSDPAAGYLDMTHLWSAAYRSEGRSILPDGLHPDIVAARRLNAPAIARALGQMTGIPCEAHSAANTGKMSR